MKDVALFLGLLFFVHDGHALDKDYSSNGIMVKVIPSGEVSLKADKELMVSYGQAGKFDNLKEMSFNFSEERNLALYGKKNETEDIELTVAVGDVGKLLLSLHVDNYNGRQLRLVKAERTPFPKKWKFALYRLCTGGISYVLVIDKNAVNVVARVMQVQQQVNPMMRIPQRVHFIELEDENDVIQIYRRD
ncbi:MAG: hypothetical protein LBJ71_01030 [Holosporaceae bacterium]|jgi:hypothetical protein|nr:hypothetical protein [Holosporaceae bacterium]